MPALHAGFHMQPSRQCWRPGRKVKVMRTGSWALMSALALDFDLPSFASVQ
jgi:hypothetical protein